MLEGKGEERLGGEGQLGRGRGGGHHKTTRAEDPTCLDDAQEVLSKQLHLASDGRLQRQHVAHGLDKLQGGVGEAEVGAVCMSMCTCG